MYFPHFWHLCARQFVRNRRARKKRTATVNATGTEHKPPNLGTAATTVPACMGIADLADPRDILVADHRA